METIKKISACVAYLSIQADNLFNNNDDENQGFSSYLTKHLLDTYIESNIIGLTAGVIKDNKGTIYYYFIFETPDLTTNQSRNDTANALVRFAKAFTEGEADIKNICRISTNLMSITFSL